MDNPKIREAVASHVRPKSHDLGCREGGGDEVGVLVAVLRHGPLAQGLGVLSESHLKLFFSSLAKSRWSKLTRVSTVLQKSSMSLMWKVWCKVVAKGSEEPSRPCQEIQNAASRRQVWAWRTFVAE